MTSNACITRILALEQRLRTVFFFPFTRGRPRKSSTEGTPVPPSSLSRPLKRTTHHSSKAEEAATDLRAASEGGVSPTKKAVKNLDATPAPATPQFTITLAPPPSTLNSTSSAATEFKVEPKFEISVPPTFKIEPAPSSSSSSAAAVVPKFEISVPANFASTSNKVVTPAFSLSKLGADAPKVEIKQEQKPPLSEEEEEEKKPPKELEATPPMELNKPKEVSAEAPKDLSQASAESAKAPKEPSKEAETIKSPIREPVQSKEAQRPPKKRELGEMARGSSFGASEDLDEDYDV